MKDKHLRMKWATQAVLIGLLLGAADVTNSFAQNFTVGDLNYSRGPYGDVGVTGHKDGSNAEGDLYIPSSVTYNETTYSVSYINFSAFRNCNKLTSVIIGDAILSIAEGAFQNCTNLSSVILPSSLRFLGGSAFENCIGLTHITIPNQVTTIEGRTCSGCSNLHTVTIGKSVTKISYLAFSGCTQLSAITILAETPPTFLLAGNVGSTYAFEDVSKNIPVYVPNNSTQNYSSASYWRNFTNYQIASIFVGSNSNWNVASNWNPSTIPGITSSAVIDEDFSGNLVEVYDNATIGYLSIMDNKSLAIKPNKTLRINGSLSTNGLSENLVIENGAQLYTISEGAQATMQKAIAAHSDNGGWYFISSSVATNVTPSTDNRIISSTPTNYDLYFYDEPAHYWRNYKESDNSLYSGFNIEPLKGYLYANASPVTLSFAGTLQAGNSVTTSTLSCQADELKGYNLVGNPFPCNAYANRPYYVMNADGNTILATPVSTSEPIAPCTGIVVQAFDTEQNPTVTFSTTAPSTSNQGNLNIILSQQVNRSNTVIDNAVVSFDEGTRLGKFYFMQQDANIYIPLGKEDYAIAFSDKQGEMPLNFKASKSGEYTITVNPEGVELAYLHLIDNMTGADVDLLGAGDRGSEPAMRAEGTSYTFTAKTTDYESRFKLVFVANNVDGSSTGSETFAFIDASGNIIITTDVSDATLQVIDAMGRVVRTVGLSQCGSRIPIVGMTSGVYVLRLIDGEDVKVQKIVVR